MYFKSNNTYFQNATGLRANTLMLAAEPPQRRKNITAAAYLDCVLKRHLKQSILAHYGIILRGSRDNCHG